MIYEYPEEFIVTVIYVNDLKEQSSYRYKKDESLREWKLLILDEELEGDKIFQGNIDVETKNESENISFLDMEVQLLQKPYKEAMFNDNMVGKSLEDENIKSILSDIDEDYAISETLSI